MARIIMVHGAFNELWGPHEIKARWLPALRDGLWHHHVSVDAQEVAVCFYGDLFRLDPEKIDQDAWQQSRAGTAEMLSSLAGGDTGIKALEQAANQATWERTVDLVTILATDAAVEKEARRRLLALIGPDTQVIVAHSLGTILSYKVLLEHPELSVDTLVTLGSPLGTNEAAVMLPAKSADGLRPWPGSTRHWINIAALGDKVTGDGCLTAHFGTEVSNHRVDNGHRHHDPEPYLNAAVTGAAVASGLAPQR